MHLWGAGLTPVCLEMTWSSRPSFLGLQVQQEKSCTQFSFRQALGLPCLQAGSCGVSQHLTKLVASGLSLLQAPELIPCPPGHSHCHSALKKEQQGRWVSFLSRAQSAQAQTRGHKDLWPAGLCPSDPVWCLPEALARQGILPTHLCLLVAYRVGLCKWVHLNEVRLFGYFSDDTITSKHQTLLLVVGTRTRGVCLLSF